MLKCCVVVTNSRETVVKCEIQPFAFREILRALQKLLNLQLAYPAWILVQKRGEYQSFPAATMMIFRNFVSQ
jgi:hypothetical protein